jgi:putative hydrolase of the HAD superfamily
MPEPYDAVLLDLYDTIVWSEWASLRDKIASRLGVDARTLVRAFDQTRPLRGVGQNDDVEGDMAQVLEAVGIDPAPDLVEELVQLERSELDHGVHLYEDVLPTLAALREGGVRLGLVSNCSHSTRPVVDRLGLEDAFDQVLLSYEVQAMKPEPAIYVMALERLGGIPAERAVFVDDQPDYCDGGAAVGMATRLILRASEDAPADHHGHRVVTDLRWLL